jgi:hypothetical protein
MYSSRLRWAIVNEDRHCEARRWRARIPWSIKVLGPAHGPARPACGTLRDFVGICWNLRDHCWNMLEFAGLCGTMLDLLDHLRGMRGMIGHRA